ncbi:tRNA-queuosine alpha-mannosyltransferase domain-containing protein [Haliea sp. E17]|uniref:tRNA-queuosine alpha-mannosyltransferase domain-containing protein n=1 Tax=Haliea sp. E17 TaxID=3401576 RepID=UPI003AAA8C0B
MRVLLLSAYAAQSHRYWRDALQGMFPDWQWQVMELPPRYFSWRVRGNPLHWSIDQRAQLEAGYDLLVATSMTDLATLRGLVPALASVPSVLYFHENQFGFPSSQQQGSLLEAQMVSLYSALAADRLLFNSAFNRDSFLIGLDGLLRKLPDYVPGNVVESLRKKSSVLAVPIQSVEAEPGDPWPTRQGEELRILWSARFEYDKGGDRLHALLWELDAGDVNFRIAVTGEQFRASPPVFRQIREDFAHRLTQFGFVESVSEYHAWQRGADAVLSTAMQEFQGLAVMEAVLRGCEPVLPDRLAYREYFPQSCRYASHPDDIRAEATAAADHLRALAQRKALAPDISACTRDSLQPRYARLFEAVMHGAG